MLSHVFFSRIRLVGVCQPHPDSRADREPVRSCSRRTEPSSRHGLPTPARPSGGRCARCEPELCGARPAAVRERDAVDPAPAGGVRGQPLGVQQRAPGSGLHALLPALHPTVRTTRASAARCGRFCPRASCVVPFACRQVLEAYRNGRVEKAMSFGFLFFIFTGDLSNFVGCYLTRQLPIQVNL